jgi:hypothetical protein
VEVGNGHIQCGTAAVLDDLLVVTCKHVVEDRGVVMVEDSEGWVICKVLKEDADFDLAYMEPARKLKPVKRDLNGTHIFGSALGEPIKAHDAELIGSASAASKGFDHGCSGAPIVKDGKLVGITTAGRAFAGAFIVDQQDRKTAVFVPRAMVDDLRPK